MCLIPTVKLSSSHWSTNLEPYPDGLLYVSLAKSIASGQGLRIFHLNYQWPLTIPPIYSLLLSVGWLFSHQPQSFYLVNQLLFSGSVILLALALKNSTTSWKAGLWGGSLLASQPLLWWSVGLPMAEQATLFLITLFLWLINRPKSIISVLLLPLIPVLIIATKYVMVITAGVMALILLFQSPSRVALRRNIMLLAIASGIFYGYLLYIGFNPWGIFSYLLPSAQKVGASPSLASTTFFSFNYVWPNFINYVKILFQAPSHYLWVTTPMVSGLVSILIFIIALRSRFKYLAGWWWFLVLSHFPLLLVFITVDMRYVITLLPLLIFGVIDGLWQAWHANRLPWRQELIGVGCVMIILHTWWLQLPLAKTTLVSNWLGRSVPWQHQAIQELDLQLAPDDTLITALPPLLVDLYRHQSYQLLPLSTHQEFANHSMPVWGPLDYSDLVTEYHQRLASDQRLMVTNAYITHQTEVVMDYEKLRQNFEFKLVAAGCQGSCDLYELKLLE